MEKELMNKLDVGWPDAHKLAVDSKKKLGMSANAKVPKEQVAQVTAEAVKIFEAWPKEDQENAHAKRKATSDSITAKARKKREDEYAKKHKPPLQYD
jgi:hypothetical protein